MPHVCYVCFDGDNDIHYYRLMTAWNKNPNFDFSFENAHDITQARDTSTEETIKRSLRIRLKASDVLLVLIGESTRYLHKFVRWEIEVALELGLAVIGVNLNGKRGVDNERCPAIMRNVSAIHIPFNLAIVNYAIKNWPTIHNNHSEPRGYIDSVYNALGL